MRNGLPILTRLLLLSSLCAVPAVSIADFLEQFTQREMVAGLKDALRQGAANAVTRLSRENGFFADQKVKIPLPGPLKRVERIMRTLGMKKQADDLVLAMNRAAEAAVPEAQALLVDAIKTMSVQDAVGILRGADNAATQYFRNRTEPRLRDKFLPIVTQATEKVGLAAKYNVLAGQAAKFRLIEAQEANLEQFVTQKALDGLYWVMAEEEKAIRQNPIKATTQIARKIFEGLLR